MDKTPFDNEDVSPVEPSNLDTEHAVIVNLKPIDVLSLPRKESKSDLDSNSNSGSDSSSGSADNENFMSSNKLSSKESSSNESSSNMSPSSEQPVDEPALDNPLLDDNWLQLSQDWQAQPYEKTDIPALVKQTRKRTLYAKVLLAINVIATLSVCIALLVALYQGDWGTPTIAYLAFGSIGSIIFVYYEMKIRLRIWRQCCDSPDKAITNAVAGIESSITYIKLTKFSFWLSFPVVNWYVYVMYDASEKSVWPPLLFINSFVVIGWSVTHWFHLKRKKELTQLLSYNLS